MINLGYTQQDNKTIPDTDITRLNDVLSPILNGILEYNYITAVIEEISNRLRVSGYPVEEAVRVLMNLTITPEVKEKTPQIIKDTYNNPRSDNDTHLTKIITTDEIPKSTIRRAEATLFETIYRGVPEGAIIGILSENEQVIADPYNKRVTLLRINIRNGRDYSNTHNIINAYPQEVTIYETPLEGEGRRITTTWHSEVLKYNLTIKDATIDDTYNELRHNGLIQNRRRGEDVLTTIINAYIENGRATLKTGIQTPGFYYQRENKEIITKEKYRQIEIKELQRALTLLERLRQHYKHHEDKLATIIKWGLISPFIYVMKQNGHWIPWLYLYGKAKSGKTTLGQLILNLWRHEGINNYNYGGSAIETPARLGEKIRQDTYPILVNEPGGAFNNTSVQEMIKSSIESTTSRGKFHQGQYINIPALNPVIITSNRHIPQDEALTRRLLILNFTHDEKKSDEDIREFDKYWQPTRGEHSRFQELRPITHHITNEILGNPKALIEAQDWREYIDQQVRLLYYDCEMPVPEWIMKWSETETIEDAEEENKELIRSVTMQLINQAYTKRITVVDDEYGRPQDMYKLTDDMEDGLVDTTSIIYERVKTLAVLHLIPWLQYVRPYGMKPERVRLTSSYKRELGEKLWDNTTYTMRDLSEMNYKYKWKVIRTQDKWVIEIPLDEFVRWLSETNTSNTGTNDE